jgi:hypothetical protein
VTPLRFDVRAADGRLLDTFTEDELATAGTPKVFAEAAAWAHVAIAADRRHNITQSGHCGLARGPSEFSSVGAHSGSRNQTGGNPNGSKVQQHRDP